MTAKAAVTQQEHILKICDCFVERAKAGGLKGKRREDEALAFACGYATGVGQTNEDLAKNLGAWIALVLCVRGYAEIERIVREADAKAA